MHCASHRGVKLIGVHATAESDSAVCITPLSQAPRCASYRGVKLRGVHHTAESKCTPGSQNRNLYKSLGAFKGTIRRNPLRGEHIYHERIYLKYVGLLINFFCLRSDNFVIEYLGEIGVMV